MNNGAPLIALLMSLMASAAFAHEHTKHAIFASRQAPNETRVAAVNADSGREPRTDGNQQIPHCRLTIELSDADTHKSLPGLIKITQSSTGQPLKLTEWIQRDNDWYATKSPVEINLPQESFDIHALHGLQREQATHRLNLVGKEQAHIRIELKPFYNTARRGLRGGNTHLHLMFRDSAGVTTNAQAIEYLQTVPRADNLDLVFLSYLRRIEAEKGYVTNAMVENDLFGGGDLQRLTQYGTLFCNGEEHRHNSGNGWAEGYGHVMLLDLVKLIRPVSIGAAIMGTGSDGIPLHRGIREARGDGGTIVWCHNSLGSEDIPNWAGGFVDAQNLFDGGEASAGDYDKSFYRYLNIGLRVPVSTGTDWFIYDFSRVYVPVEGEWTAKSWLEQLKAGRSFITNGPLLEFQLDNHQVGDMMQISRPTELTVQARSVGRRDFKKIELIFNGQVVHSAISRQQDQHYVAEMNQSVMIDRPGWWALRVPVDADKKNEFGHPIFAHTSPIYVDFDGRHVFDPDVANELIDELRRDRDAIETTGLFDAETDRDTVLQVYEEGILNLKTRLRSALESAARR